MEMVVSFPGGMRVNAGFGPFTIQTDQPVDDGGEGSAPSPFALFLASIATCTGYYVLSFCRQRGIPADDIRIVQALERDPGTSLVSRIRADIQLPEDFPEKYRDAVVKVAGKCTVKKHLEHPPAIDISVSRRSTKSSGQALE